MSVATIPPGLVPQDVAVASIRFTTIGAAYSGSLVIPFGLIIFYSPPAIRRSPIFPTLLLCLLGGITYGFLSFHTNVQAVQLQATSRGVFLGSISLVLLIPIFTDSVLIYKILFLFSAINYSKHQRAFVASPPVVLTIPRLIIVSYFLSKLAKIYDKDSSTAEGGLLAASKAILTIRLILAEFVLQFVSNLYCSAILFFQAYRLTRGTRSIHRGSTFQKRFNQMLGILASSFIVPVCIQLAVIISTLTTENQLIRESILWSNTYVSLHCAVLATVWSSIGQVDEQQKKSSTSTDLVVNSSSSPSRVARTKEIEMVQSSPAFSTSQRMNRDDIERNPSFSSLAKPPTLSLSSDHGSPNWSFTAWEKSSDA